MLLYENQKEFGLLKEKVIGLPWVTILQERNIGTPFGSNDPAIILAWCHDLPSAIKIKRKSETVENTGVLLFCPHSQLRLLRLMKNTCFQILDSASTPEAVGSAILALCHNATDSECAEDTPILLTGREKQVIDLLVSGQCNKEIAQVLGIKNTTVVAHKKHLFMKIGVHSTQELVVWALLRHLGA